MSRLLSGFGELEARTYVNLQGGWRIRDAKTCTALLPALLEDVLERVHRDSWGRIGEAVALKLGGCAMPSTLRIAASRLLLAQPGDAWFLPTGAVRLMAGFMSGACKEKDDKSHHELVTAMFELVVSDLPDARPASRERLHEQIRTVALAGLHPRYQANTRWVERGPVRDVSSWIDGVARLHAVLRRDRRLGEEDPARALASVCEGAGGAVIESGCREQLLAYAAAGGGELSAHARGLMAYHLALASRLFERPGESEAWLLPLARGAGGDVEALGMMAWGIGLHLCDEDPFMEDWHENDRHLLTDSEAPRQEVITALVRHIRPLPADCRERLFAGLEKVAALLPAREGKAGEGAAPSGAECLKSALAAGEACEATEESDEDSPRSSEARAAGAAPALASQTSAPRG
ncbi:hypothetical protein [Ramlibacter rhizophilus]|uniref:Uncharacterized protein n=1 Tax=Ramlibacter rhizophilus TaxID=1781167 RepID=A0A4Z0BDL7_9BURK|nr:hypothetical protein [Ramlibacter rhizophilus]TFY96563.1 hypothetical protein EZ242_21315 [Ramlibacter rhizophilus]